MQPAPRPSSSIHDDADDAPKSELAQAPSVDAPARVPSRLGPEPCWMDGLQPCPVFQPTREEFKDPLAYIESVRAAIAPYGMAKVIPPMLVSTGCVDALRSHKLPVQQQVVRRFVWEDFQKPRHNAYQLRTMSAFAKVADSVLNKAFRTTLAMPANTVEVCCAPLRRPARARSRALGHAIQTQACAHADRVLAPHERLRGAARRRADGRVRRGHPRERLPRAAQRRPLHGVRMEPAPRAHRAGLLPRPHARRRRHARHGAGHAVQHEQLARAGCQPVRAVVPARRRQQDVVRRGRRARGGL